MHTPFSVWRAVPPTPHIPCCVYIPPLPKIKSCMTPCIYMYQRQVYNLTQDHIIHVRLTGTCKDLLT